MGTEKQKQKKLILMITAFGIYFIIYLAVLIRQANFWGYILSPLGYLSCSVVVLNLYLRNRCYKTLGFILLNCSLYCLVWAGGDILWGFDELVRGVDPANNYAGLILYMLSSVFLAIAFFTFSFYQFRRWNGIQLLIDAVVLASSTIYLLWILFFDRDMAMIIMVYSDGWISCLTLLFDFSIFIGLTVWYLSVRSDGIPLPLRLITTGLFLYVLVDVYYYYIYFYGLYASNTVIDAAYMVGPIIMTIGLSWGIYCWETGKIDLEIEQSSNIGARQKSLFILVCPTLSTFLNGMVIRDWLIFVLIIMIYEALNSYVRTAIATEQLLGREREMNTILEERIAERTVELVSINRQLLEKNSELDYLSHMDTVTNLYNRRYFINTLEKRLHSIKAPESMALIFIDLDRFKTINDSYGHDVGDQVLMELAKRLSQWQTEHIFLARLGGDEFVFACHGKNNYREIEMMAEKIIAFCSIPIVIERYTFHVTLSVGISIYPLDADSCSTLMKNADIAMYHAKKQGYNCFVSFNALLNEGVHRKNKIEILLRKADFNQEFELFYQPQFSIPEKKLIGIEALLRWHQADNGFISPAEFIPIAEEIDYIVPIGAWVMQEAVRQIARWNTAYGLELKMGINISPKELNNTNFIAELKRAMQINAVDAAWLDIEITENIAIEGEYRIAEIASIFEDLGVSISIDDFGTGYSSLSYLKLFPFDRIKIAKPLVDALTTDHYDMHIVKAICMLARSIGIKTIAEGVELPEQLDLLVELGCEEVQGFLLGRPMSAASFEQVFLAAGLVEQKPESSECDCA